MERSNNRRTWPVALATEDVPAEPRRRGLPPPFGDRLTGRVRKVLGDRFGLRNFGINLTRLEPGAMSSLRHAHSQQDEFVFILQGAPTLITDDGETLLAPGMCAGFRAGTGNAHHLVNRGDTDVIYLEIGDRNAGDIVDYPDDDASAELGADGHYCYRRNDGTVIG
jgi:uncharacterized cupin superfamily protein